ncbi:MAG: hypothetical protein INR62_03265 [Rhodospirillales bacterium]|nr:hypothetical protein [Acetobacter sp.]
MPFTAASMDEPPSGFGVTADDLRAYDWMAIIRRASGKQYYHYGEALFAEADRLQTLGPTQGQKVCRFLATVCAIPLDLAAVPPGMPAAVGRFSSQDLDALIAVFPEVSDPELKAHLGDLIWQCRKNAQTRQIQRLATEAYGLAAGALDGPIWLPSLERFRRAMQLCAQLGPDDPLRQRVPDAIERMIERHKAEESGLMCARLMELLAYYKLGDPTAYLSESDVIARRLEAKQSFAFAREYWEVKATWHLRAKDRPGALVARQAAAQTYLSEAEAMAAQPNPSYLNICSQMNQGVEALIRAEADDQRIEKAHRRLLQLQARQLDELHPAPDPRDEIPGLVQLEEFTVARARAGVSGLSPQEAIRRLASGSITLVNPVELRLNEERLFQECPINYLDDLELFDGQGRTKGIRPAVNPYDAEQTEAAFTAAIFHSASMFHWTSTAELQIEPARTQIEHEHAIAPRDLAFLVMDNPFVPADRAGLYARGLYAGLKGDLVLAVHLLIPQLEHSIRAVLERKGTITSKLEDGIQDSYLLRPLLNRPEVAAIFGQKSFSPCAVC